MNPKLQAQIATREQVLARIRAMLISELHLRRAPEDIDPDAPLFGTGLGLDSVDAVELVVSLESDFGVKVESDWMSKVRLRTVNSLVDLVLSKPQVHGAPDDD